MKISKEVRTHYSRLGKLGGSVKSDKKAKACRENGKKYRGNKGNNVSKKLS